MDKVLSYKGYVGSAKMSLEDNCLFGEVLFVNDLITYEGSTPDELRKAFVDAVDHYLARCAEEGLNPDKPCSGSFNVRIPAELHRAACVRAETEGKSLNEFVKDAISAAVSGERTVVNETHQHTHTHIQRVEILTQQQTYGDPGLLWQKAPERVPQKH